MMNQLANSDLVDEAYNWLCQQRKHFPVNSDVWDVRFHWEKVKAKLIAELSSDTFTFKPLQKVTKSTGEVIHVWTSIDSLVLKLLSLVLSRYLPSSKLCTHLKGNGGSKHTVTGIHNQVSSHTFVFRTDVKSYYESINHEILLDKLSVFVKDKQVMNLLAQYAKRSVEYGGLFTDFTQGISSGCSLSPLISSFYLYELDKEMESKPVFYRRYMDDLIVLSTSRWKLRKAIKTVNQHFAKLKLKQHPDKTTIGRIKSGFDFLGYQFGEDKITVSKRTLGNHIRRLSQLYEQKKRLPNWQAFLDDYRQHWVTWVYSGIPSSIIRNNGTTVKFKRTSYDANLNLTPLRQKERL